MTDALDQNLMREYARNGAEESFGELVHRHVDLVYSTAFRVLRNASLAEEVTQRVFVALAQNATKLQHRAVLAGWLHQTARNFAIATVRSEERRRQRERDAASLETFDSNDSQAGWDQLAPHLDGALARLSESDRDAILLRYFERKTAREIGERLGLTEEAAQKRAARALDRLRMILAERGPLAPMAGLASLLSIQAIQSAPVGLTASVIAASGSAGAVMPITSTIGLFMASTKLKIGLAAALMAGISTPLVIQHQTNARLRGEIAALRQNSAALDRLQNENQRLSALQPDAREAERRREERAELMRLRGEVTALRAQASVAPKNREESAQVKPPKPSVPEAPLIRAEAWANVGLATPSAAFQTLTWAKANRDTNVIANSLAWSDEHSRSSIEALFASAPESVRSKYGSADAFILSLFDFPTPDDSRRAVSFRILNENIVGDQATVVFEQQMANGETFTGPMRYVRIGDTWRQALDFDEPATSKLGKVLQAQPSASTNPSEGSKPEGK
jgi:RNA polymerase sigma factor (sigma-70 family)